MTYYICYPEGKHKALTMSYDDGRSFDRRLVDIFNQYGIKGTFHLNGGLFPDVNPEQEHAADRIPAKEVATLYQGHEVAAHTLTHPTIARCPLDQVAQEVLSDRRMLESLTGAPVQGMSYPNGSFNQDIKELLPALGISYSRVVGSSHSFALPTDWYQWQATCHHNQRLMEHAEAFLGLFKKQYLYLMYVWGHSFEFDNDQNWDLMEAFCEKVGGKADIWYCTNIEFQRYLTAAKQVIFTVDGSAAYNPSALTVWYEINNEIVALSSGLNQLA